MTSTTPAPERRQSDRRRACYGGTLRIAAFLPEVECRLRDHSLTGARIVVAEGVALPRRIELTVTCRNQTRHAEVMWRSGTQVGLAFRDDPRTGVAADSSLEARSAWDAAAPTNRLH